MEKLSLKEYESKYGQSRTWTCTLSDGTLYKLKENTSENFVTFNERLEYCELVKRVRMNEADNQAIQ